MIKGSKEYIETVDKVRKKDLVLLIDIAHLEDNEMDTLLTLSELDKKEGVDYLIDKNIPFNTIEVDK